LAFSSRPQHFKGVIIAAARAAHAVVIIITLALNLVLIIMLMPVVAAMDLLVVRTPVGEVVFRREEAEKDFAMRRDALEKSGIGQGARADAGTKEAPQFVIVASHAQFPGFVGRSDGFFVQQAGFFPKGALRRNDARNESGMPPAFDLSGHLSGDLSGGKPVSYPTSNYQFHSVIPCH